MRPAVAGWPGAGRLALGLLLILSLARLAVAALTPLSPDEAYYWVWSRALAGGYPDHPPMVALWIRVGCWLVGDNPLGVRLLGPVAAALGSVLLARAGEDLLPGRNAGLVAAALMNATLLFGIGAVTMTPDTPLLFFWTAALWALGRLLATGWPGWWLVAGLATGLALDSKYTAVLLPAGVLVWVVAVPSMRPWLRRPWSWVAAGLALLLFTPVLAWNAAHDWISFAKQGARTGDWQPGRALQFLGELLGGQIGLATPVLAVLFGAGMVVALRKGLRREPGWTLLAALTILPALVFLQHALGDRVQANWPSIMYPAAAIAAAGLGGRWTALRKPGIALGLGLTLLVWVQGAAAPLPLPMRADPTLMRVGGWDVLAADVEAARRRVGADFVVSENYGHSAILALLMPPGVPVLGADPRWALFDLPDARPEVIGRVGLLLRSARLDDRPDMADWSEITPLGEVTRSRGGMTAEVFRLYRVVGRAGNVPIAEMPRPR
jgi:4-amino-4-deoxy-L-arabinose transferase-like glycosyltransferase